MMQNQRWEKEIKWVFKNFNYICIVETNKKIKIMKARVSHTGKIIVEGKEMLKGRGIQYKGIVSNGDYRFLMTEPAYVKISHRCTWVN